MITWTEPLNAPSKLTMSVAARVFFSLFKHAIIASGFFVLIVGLAVGNVFNTMKFASIVWVIAAGIFAILFLVSKYAPKRIGVNEDAITVTHLTTREYDVSEIEQITVSCKELSLNTLSFNRKARNTSIKVMIGIAPEIDLNELCDLLKIKRIT